MRDIKGDYRRAYLERYRACLGAGRVEDAKRIAGILRDHYECDVTSEEAEAAPTAELETAVPDRAPEDATELKPEPADKPAPKAVREWATEQGLDVPARGRLPEDVVEAYQRAHEG